MPSHVDDIWSALAITEAPEIIKNIHLDYIEAGSDFITINNYAVTQPILARNDISDQLEDLTLRSVELAKDAVKESGKNTLIAGSLPPLETSYRADLILPENQMLDYYCELVDILENEVDIIICETMSSSSEAKCALPDNKIARARVRVQRESMKTCSCMHTCTHRMHVCTHAHATVFVARARIHTHTHTIH